MEIENLDITEVSIGKDYIQIYWCANIGFGVYTLINKDGKLVAESECLDSNENKTFLKMLLDKLIENVDIIE